MAKSFTRMEKTGYLNKCFWTCSKVIPTKLTIHVSERRKTSREDSQTFCIWCAKGLNPTFYRQIPLSYYMAIPPLHFFPQNLPHLTFFNNIVLMTYGVKTKRNSQGKVISSCLEDYKTTLQAIFISKTFICNTRLRFDSK